MTNPAHYIRVVKFCLPSKLRQAGFVFSTSVQLSSPMGWCIQNGWKAWTSLEQRYRFKEIKSRKNPLSTMTWRGKYWIRERKGQEEAKKVTFIEDPTCTTNFISITAFSLSSWSMLVLLTHFTGMGDIAVTEEQRKLRLREAKNPTYYPRNN